MKKHVEETISGGLWIFLGSLSVSLTGFLFWMVISRIVGVGNIGVASSIISSVSIAVTLVSAGLNFAVIREVAANGARSFTASLIIGIVSGTLATLIVQPLVLGIGYSELSLFASIMAIVTILSSVFQFSLIGFEKFRAYFISSLLGSLVKLIIGVVLAVLGLKLLSPLIGYMACPLVIMIVSAFVIISTVKVSDYKPALKDLRDLVVLMFSNYPYMFSNQLLTMLSIYLFAYLIGEPVSTGTLYISFMIVLAISSIPFALINASLPIGTRHNTDPFYESFRIGLAVATPVIVLAISLSQTILRIINPELVGGACTLRILLLTIVPLTGITTIIARLNKERRVKTLGLIGLARFILLILLLPLLAKNAGINGVAMSFLFSNVLVFLTVIVMYREFFYSTAIMWGIHVLAFLLSFTQVLNEFSLAIITLPVSLMILYVSRTLTFKEIYDIVMIINNTLRGSK